MTRLPRPQARRRPQAPTAAGMAVAIPAQIALTWFESVVDRLRHDMEDAGTLILHGARPSSGFRQAAE